MIIVTELWGRHLIRAHLVADRQAAIAYALWAISTQAGALEEPERKQRQEDLETFSYTQYNDHQIYLSPGDQEGLNPA